MPTSTKSTTSIRPSFRLRPTAPPEISEALKFVRWYRCASKAHPELGLIFHIPNGGARDIQTGARLKSEGVLAGMPDYCLPVPRGGFGALYIELKRIEGGQVSPKQSELFPRLKEAGNRVVIAKGWEAARDAVLEYLSLPIMDDWGIMRDKN